MEAEIVAEMGERLRHYHTKCIQHLNRVRLSHVLALKALQNEQALMTQECQSLVRASFVDMPPTEKLAKMHEALHSQHLCSLKINFEQFLNRLLTTVWSFNFTKLAAKVSGREEVKLRELADSIVAAGESSVDMRDFFIGRIVPVQGLETFDDAFRDATQIRLRDVLYGKNHRYWPQILTAFEIRHLVEHRDGSVDVKFRRVVKDVWSNSSWGELSLDRLRKVPVREADVIETHGAMLNAADLITERLL